MKIKLDSLYLLDRCVFEPTQILKLNCGRKEMKKTFA